MATFNTYSSRIASQVQTQEELEGLIGDAVHQSKFPKMRGIKFSITHRKTRPMVERDIIQDPPVQNPKGGQGCRDRLIVLRRLSSRRRSRGGAEVAAEDNRSRRGLCHVGGHN